MPKRVIDISDEDFEIIKHNVKMNNPLSPMNQEDVMIMIANSTSLDDIKAEIEEERKSVHLSAFVGNQVTGEYSNLLYDGEHRGLIKALDIIDKHIGERSSE